VGGAGKLRNLLQSSEILKGGKTSGQRVMPGRAKGLHFGEGRRVKGNR